MNKWLREKLDTWDLRSVFLIIAFMSIGVFVFLYFTDIRDRFRQDDKDEFKGIACASRINVWTLLTCS
jgi:hypothetical protein